MKRSLFSRVIELFLPHSAATPRTMKTVLLVLTLIAIMTVSLIANSPALASKASHHYSKRAAPHHSTTTDPGGVTRDPADLALDRKIGSICRGC
jgi:hypothetical protein